MNILAIGCHPDDVEIACAGTLAKCVQRGDTVIVCHASSGNLGHVVIPPDELKVMRANEAKKAGSLAGIEVIHGGFDDLEIYENNKNDLLDCYILRIQIFGYSCYSAKVEGFRFL